MSAAKAALDADTVVIVGLGLIGGSIARGLRAAGYAGEIVGVVADAAEAEHARALDLADRVETDTAAAIGPASLVVVAVPIGAMAGVFARLGESARADTVITDVGSTKLSVMHDARAALGTHWPRYVPGHPISGTERSGLAAGFATLFDDRRVILTPTPETEPQALAAVEQLWRALGARISEMDAAHHDEVLAATSHLPHVLAFALVDTLARMAERTEVFEYAAGGFADFTRIASSDPALWADIVTANHDALLGVLTRYIGDLDALRAALAEGDRQTLLECFERAKTARDRYAANGGRA